MSPINFQLYEELPEPVFLQMQRKEAEEKQAAEKKKQAEISNIYYNQKYEA
jgi:hypothetical protein